MIPIIGDYLMRQRWQILGWGLSLALFAAMILSIFGSVIDQMGQFGGFLQSMPPAFLAAMGMKDVEQFLTPVGFVNAEFFAFTPLILGILAISLGSGLLVSDEEDGILDLLMAQPISRTTLFSGRTIGMILTLLAVIALPFLAFVLSPSLAEYELSIGGMLQGFLSLFAILLFFAALALLLSFVLPARRLAAAVAGAVLIGAFFLTTLKELDNKFDAIGRLSPLTYYQGGKAITELNVAWLVGLLGVSLLFIVLAWQLFERRDLRVGGEGSGPSLKRVRLRRAAGATATTND